MASVTRDGMVQCRHKHGLAKLGHGLGTKALSWPLYVSIKTQNSRFSMNFWHNGAAMGPLYHAMHKGVVRAPFLWVQFTCTSGSQLVGLSNDLENHATGPGGEV